MKDYLDFLKSKPSEIPFESYSEFLSEEAKVIVKNIVTIDQMNEHDPELKGECTVQITSLSNNDFNEMLNWLCKKINMAVTNGLMEYGVLCPIYKLTVPTIEYPERSIISIAVISRMTSTQLIESDNQ